MGIRDRFEDYRTKIRFSDLDLASRSIALLWLETFQDRVFRLCFPQVASRSLREDIASLLNSAYFEGYILARAAEERELEKITISHPERPGDVEETISRLMLLYEQADIGGGTFLEEDPGVGAVARYIIMEISASPLFRRVEERDLLRLNIEYALKAGYLLAIFERRLLDEGG
jgi:hypothetical protein